MGVMKKDKKLWGNSVLAFNYKNWPCSYCGLPLKDNARFQMEKFDGNPVPYILCTKTCEQLQIIKIDMTHYDK